jgi:nucleoside-diphosphate-sugar epimerase
MILVTGATGLVGQDVLRALASEGRHALALVRDEDGATVVRSLGATPLFGAVEDEHTWQQPMPALDGIVHSAAIVAEHVGWERFHGVNVRGTELACGLAHRHDVPLVHVSSVSVYGRRAADDTPLSIAEDYAWGPLDDRDYYARSKRMAEEHVAVESRRGLRACSLRPCVIYGPGDRLLLPRLLAAGQRGWLPLIGAGDKPMALVHSASVAQAVVAALDSDSGWGRAYNVTGDAPVTTIEIIRAVSKAVGRDVRTVRLPTTAMLRLARLGEGMLSLLGPRRYPGTLTGAVRFWRGGDAYNSEAIRRDLSWNPTLDHPTALVDALRAVERRGAH